MSNTLKFSGAIQVGQLAADPSNPQKGLIYYNTTADEYRHYNGTSFVAVTSQEDLDAILGTLDGSPTNYTPTEATHAGHLAGIDTALATAGGSEFADDQFRVTGSVDSSKKVAIEADGLTTATTRTITMPDSNVDLGDIATNNAKVSADGSVTSHSDVTDAGSGAIITGAERTKLSGIEAGADVTDATNVDAAGATMNTDSDVSGNTWVLDEDTMSSNDATKVPTQQSVKTYVDTEVANAVASSVTYQGGYDAATNSPDLDTSPSGIVTGDMYTVTVAGTFFATALEVGDVLIAEQDNPTLESHWTVVNKDLDAASIKSSYESNSDTNAFTDAEKTLLGNQSGTNTGDEPAASETVVGVVELATQAEVDTGTDNTRAVTPASLATIQTDVDANTAKVGYTAAQAKSDVVNDSITDGNTDTAPSENAVFDALAAKLANVSEDTTPQLGGNLDLNGNDIEDASNDITIAPADSIKRAKQGSKTDFIAEEYIHGIALSASQTNTAISALQFPHASFEGLEITYKVKESTSNDVKIGTFRVVTNGSNISYNDMGVETADTGITFDAVINGANVDIRYSSGANGATMRADAKFIKA